MKYQIQGTGLGLRSDHYQTILAEKPDIPWFEVMTDNYMGAGGQPHAYLEAVRQDYPITFHGVGLSLGGGQPLSPNYLQRLKALINRYEPTLISDHLSFSKSPQHNSHELLPLPYTEQVVQHFVERIQQVQEGLGRQILVENLSSYLTFKQSDMNEWDFVSEVAKRADCGILLDVNNIYVSAYNHGFSSEEYLDNIPAERVQEIHLAGYEEQDGYLLDTHGAQVYPAVWQLYQKALAKVGDVPTLIEWDTDIPNLDCLIAEKARADAIRQQVLELKLTSQEVKCEE